MDTPDKITVTAEGPDEDEAIVAMETLFRENLCSNDISIETSSVDIEPEYQHIAAAQVEPSVQFNSVTDNVREETEKEISALIRTMDMGEWIHCPWCGKKTRLKIRADTDRKTQAQGPFISLCAFDWPPPVDFSGVLSS